MSVKVLSTKVLIGTPIYEADGTAILRGLPNHAKVLPLTVQKE